jgi:hypothetical protein
MPLNPRGRQVQPLVKRRADHTKPPGAPRPARNPSPGAQSPAATLEDLRPCAAPRNSVTALGCAANGQPPAAPGAPETGLAEELLGRPSPVWTGRVGASPPNVLRLTCGRLARSRANQSSLSVTMAPAAARALAIGAPARSNRGVRQQL